MTEPVTDSEAARGTLQRNDVESSRLANISNEGYARSAVSGHQTFRAMAQQHER